MIYLLSVGKINQRKPVDSLHKLIFKNQLTTLPTIYIETPFILKHFEAHQFIFV